MSQPVKHEFKAEIKQLLDIITHSLYTNKEIFIRELVSNASDALDKLRFESSRGTEIADPDLPLEIRITLDKDKKILTIADTGIGMGEAELIEHIGTIAKSGSAEFLKRVSETGGEGGNIIGHFGVGFYSVFMVASQVVIRSKSFDKSVAAVEWRSDGLGSFELSALDEPMPRGTVIEVHLKDEEKEFVEKYRVENIIKKHSSFISFPILLDGEKVNTIEALWREPKFNIKPEQYEAFYKFLTLDTEAPLDTIHFSVDAPVQFTGLVFIPKQSMDFMPVRTEWGLDLYVRRVLIQRNNQDLLPEYLSFVKGLVDTEDLPLNVSRETLQENLVIRKMSSTIVKQVLSRLEKMAKDEPKLYEEFWEKHGKTFKFGYGDYPNRERFAELIRFNSSAMDEAGTLTSLADYASRAKEGQKEIYYLSGPNREAVTLNPHLEIFRRKGLEVLFLYEPVDVFVMETLHQYKDFTLVGAEQADIAKLEALPDVEEGKEKQAELNQEDESALGRLLVRIKEVLGDSVTEVRQSKRLSESPACLVSPDDSISPQMQKIMQIVSKDASVPKKILELNPDHVLVRNLLKIFKANPNDDFIATAAQQLFESSLLLDGYLTDPHVLVGRINSLLEKSSGWYAEVKKL